MIDLKNGLITEEENRQRVNISIEQITMMILADISTFYHNLNI